MISSDREILISINGEVQSLSMRVSRLEGEISGLRTEIKEIRDNQVILSHDLASLQTSVYWIFAAIGIFLAAVSILPSLADVFRREKEDTRTENQTLLELMKYLITHREGKAS